jgi:hypothetical protein
VRRTLVARCAAVVCAVLVAFVVAGCSSVPGNDPVAREALIRASLRSAAAKSYVAVLDADKRAPVTFTYVAPDRLRVQQGEGQNAVIVVQVALNGYHSYPGRPGVFTKKLENVPATTNAPLSTVSSLITRSQHVSRKGDAIRFDVAYGAVIAHLLVDLDRSGRIGAADLPVFDKQRKIVSYRRVSFTDYDHAPAVVVPDARVVKSG